MKTRLIERTSVDETPIKFTPGQKPNKKITKVKKVKKTKNSDKSKKIAARAAQALVSKGNF